jgi:SRSO17 transposase
MSVQAASNPHADAKLSENRFRAYLNYLVSVLTHPAQEDSLRAYCGGLILAVRKSMEPLVAFLAPAHVEAAHQAIQHFITDARWSADRLLEAVREYALPALTQHAPIQAWIIDDTGMPKKGEHSVGVAHQYCGELGKLANCQVAVTLSIANEHASLPIAYRLYLPQQWADDPERRKNAGVPEEIEFTTKPQIAIEQIRNAHAAGVPVGTAIADTAYGNDTAFRDQLTKLGIPYVLSVQGTTTVWAPAGAEPLPPKSWKGKGRKATRLQRDADRRPISVKQLAMNLPTQAYETVEWREGTAGVLSSRFAAVRVRAAHGAKRRQRAKEWLLVEWPQGATEPCKYWLSTLPKTTTRTELVQTAQLRWRIERDFQELKGELGLNKFQGRKWRGFHHHAALCIAAYGFLLAERGLFSPPGALPSRDLSFPPVPDPENPPSIPERHNPDSIRSWKRRLEIELVRRLYRCPCCQRRNGTPTESPQARAA